MNYWVNLFHTRHLAETPSVISAYFQGLEDGAVETAAWDDGSQYTATGTDVKDVVAQIREGRQSLEKKIWRP